MNDGRIERRSPSTYQGPQHGPVIGAEFPHQDGPHKGAGADDEDGQRRENHGDDDQLILSSLIDSICLFVLVHGAVSLLLVASSRNTS